MRRNTREIVQAEIVEEDEYGYPIERTQRKRGGIGFGMDSLLLLVLGGLFFASYAGKEIGFLLGVCIPLAIFAYIGERIWSKHGQFAAFASVALMVYVFTTEWGSQFMSNTIEFFTNLQKVSYGMGLFVIGAMFIWSLRRGK